MTAEPLLSRPNRRAPADPELRSRDERLESLKVVAGKLAHDFNNFLVPQFGYVTLLKEELSTAGSSTATQYLTNMENAAHKAESYIESILLGMRPHRQFSPRQFSFQALLNEMLDHWISELPGSATIRVERHIEPFEFFGDEKQWRNALGQVLANARYALAMGGELKITAAQQKLSAEEVLRLGLDSSEVWRVDVEDNGFGMPAEVMRRAFEPFFTTRTQVKAAGLGLTIVHSVALFHGGQVELRSEEDKGTRLTFWVPAGGVPAQQRSAPGRRGKSSVDSRQKILLLEDDPTIKEVLRTWLSRYNLEVHAASSAADAAKLLERTPREWSLLILELDLRDANGGEAITRASATCPELPIVALTSSEARLEYAPGSNTVIIRKPCSLKALTEVVIKHLGR